MSCYEFPNRLFSVPKPDEILMRLRAATDAERLALAKALEVTPEDDAEMLVVRLSDALRAAASATDYRAILELVAKHGAKEAKWTLNEIPGTARPDWIEDYIYAAMTFVHRPDRESLFAKDRAELQEQAERALRGDAPLVEARLDRSPKVGMDAREVAWFVVMTSPAVFVAAAAIRWFMSADMKKVAPAVFLLVHVRKRIELESALQKRSNAA